MTFFLAYPHMHERVQGWQDGSLPHQNQLQKTMKHIA